MKVRSLTIGAAAIGLAMGITYVAGIRWNTTPSMPMGLWRVHLIKQPARRGDVVTLCLPPAAAAYGRERGYLTGGECPGDVELLIKTVAALPGDQVKITTDGLAVNGNAIPGTRPLPRDDRGRDIQDITPGTYQVGPDEVWVTSTFDPRSYDSRYYGAVPIEGLRGTATPLFTR